MPAFTACGILSRGLSHLETLGSSHLKCERLSEKELAIWTALHLRVVLRLTYGICSTFQCAEPLVLRTAAAAGVRCPSELCQLPGTAGSPLVCVLTGLSAARGQRKCHHISIVSPAPHWTQVLVYFGLIQCRNGGDRYSPWPLSRCLRFVTDRFFFSP